MIISDKYKFIFLALPKTASISIRDVLQKHFQAFIYSGHHYMVPPLDRKDYFVFTAVRNPYDRIISLWKYMIKINLIVQMPFEDFVVEFIDVEHYVENSFFCQPMVSYLNDFTKTRNIDYVIRFENLQKDFYNLPFIKQKQEEQKHGRTGRKRRTWNKSLRGVYLPHQNKSKGRIPHYNPFTQSLVTKHSMNDFEKFNYPIREMLNL